jgi:VWFA-related protein
MTGTTFRAIICFAAAGVALVGAQEPEEPLATFFAPLEVPLVSVEVYVSDQAGKPMSISHFYAAPGVAEAAPEGQAQPDEDVGGAPDQDLYLVIYFDDTNLGRGRRQSAIEHLRGFLSSELPPDLMVMLVRYDGRLSIFQEFTDDTDEVVRALASLQQNASNTRKLDEDRMLREMENAATAAALSGGGDPLAAAAGSGGGADPFFETRGSSLLQEIDSYAEQTVQRTRTSLANQQNLIRSLSGLSGRKAMLVVTDGVEVRPGELLYRAWGQTFESVPSLSIDARAAFTRAFRNNLQPDFDELARFANGHRVSFYNLSAMGQGRARGFSAESRLMDEQGLFVEQAMNEDVTMAYTAGLTGGRTLVNSPALSEQLEKVSVELASYYSLAFEPAHVGDGKYHRLEVRVKGEGVKVRHREGYMDLPQSERMTDRTLAAAVHGIADNPLGIGLSNGEVTPRDDGTYLVPVIITVPIGQLVLIPSEEEHQGRISILLTVRDHQRGDLSAPQRREYPVPVRNADLAAALGQNAGFTLRLAVRPGRQRIAVGVRDEIAHTESVATLEVEVGETAGVDS